MLRTTIVATSLAVGSFFGFQALAHDEHPYYMIADVSVTDFDTYMADYGSVAIPAIFAAGGEILVGAPEVTTLEGDYPNNWTVVVKFPSEAAAMSWYNSPDYQAVIPIRHANSDTTQSTIILAPEFVPPSEPASDPASE